MKNRYCLRSHISEHKFKRMLQGYVADHTARQIADDLSLNNNSVDRYFRLFRERIVRLAGSAPGTSPSSGREYPESAGHILIGILKKNQQVHAEIIAPELYDTLAGLLSRKAGIEDIIYRADWPGYDELVDVSRDRRIRIRNTGVSGFWDFSHLRLRKFRGMHRSTFLLHLKECEWRYNNRDRDLYGMLLREFRDRPLGSG